MAAVKKVFQLTSHFVLNTPFFLFSYSVPRIPWAFAMAEASGVILCNIWLLVLLLHKHR